MLNTDSGKGFAGFFKELAKPDVRPKARELFVEEMKQAADETGIVKSHFRFYMAIGRKK